MATDYRRPGVAVENKTAPMNGRQDVGLITGIIATADDGVTTENYDVIRSAASDDTDFVVNNLSDAAVTHKGYAYTKDVDFAITAGGEINWAANTPITPPYLTDVQTTTGAATLGVGTYYYKVAAIKCMDETNRAAPSSWGVTLPSNEKSITLAVASAVRITWIAVPQAEGYYIYRGTTSGGETLLATVLGEVLTFTDIGVYTPSVTTPVAASTALRKPSYSKAATAGYVESQADVSANLGTIDGYTAAGLDINFDDAGIIELRDMGFATAAGGTGAQLAAYMQYYTANASGTYGEFFGGDASLNLTALKAVTAGRLKTIGKNLCLNGTFGLRFDNTHAEAWTTGVDWVINATNQAVHAVGAGSDTLTSSFVPVNGVTYRVTFTVDAITLAGTGIRCEVGGTLGTWRTATGTYTQDIVSGAGGTFLFRADTADACTISNITVRKILDTASFSLVSANTLSDVATLTQAAIRALGGELALISVAYNGTTGAFETTSSYRGIDSMIALEAPTAGAWTDLAGAGYLYFTGPGYEIKGAASAATCTYATGNKFKITSPTTGADSSVAITTSGVGEDLWANGAMDFDGATPVAGVDGSYTTYQVVATIAGGNYFNTEYVYTATDAADKYGANSDLAFYCEKYLQAPPAGNGGKIVAATGVPVMDRNTAQAAMTAQESVRMELSTIVTNDIDIIRDHYGHCAAMSTAAKSKWRVGIAVVNKNISTSALVALATELGSGYYGLIYDNISQDDNISPYIGALISSLPMVSDSIINRRIYTENALLSKPRLSAGTVDYLLANGIMVFDYNGDGVPCIIDDVMTAGSQFALAGAISDTMLRYRIQIALTPVTARVKMNRDGRLAAKNALVKELESQLGTLIDPEGGFTDPEVSASSSDRFKAVVRFSYTEIVTMKRIDVEYYIA
jgi:hypothetical protein